MNIKCKYVMFFSIGLGLLFYGLYVGSVNYHKNEPAAMDCAPATLHRLFPDYNIKDLKEMCHTDDKVGTDIDDLNRVWEELILKSHAKDIDFGYSTNIQWNMWEILPVYSVIDSIPARKNDIGIKFNVPYLWVGYVKENGVEGGHVALIYFTSTNVIVSNSQTIDNKSRYYYEENKSYSDFFENTYLLYLKE